MPSCGDALQYSATRCHCWHPDPVRIASSLRPDMIFGRDSDGHSGPADFARRALAERICGEVDRHRAARVPGPCADLWRGASTADSVLLRGVLQRGPPALGVGQRCAAEAANSAIRCHCCHPDPVRIASSLRDAGGPRHPPRPQGRRSLLPLARAAARRSCWRCQGCCEVGVLGRLPIIQSPRPRERGAYRGR
jgi:hypothetical protein